MQLDNVALASFATPLFYDSLDRQMTSAKHFGIGRLFAYTDRDLRRDAFYHKNHLLFAQPRGWGYWIWKPFFILKTLRKLDEGQSLLYLDAGANFIGCQSHCLT